MKTQAVATELTVEELLDLPFDELTPEQWERLKAAYPEVEGEE